MTLLVVDSVSVRHDERGRRVDALLEVSLTISRGERVGLVGPSGCGKSTLLRACLGLEPLRSGRITFDGQPVHGAPKRLRARFQPVLQDSFSALDPRMTIAQSLAEPLDVHARPNGEREIAALLKQVGLPLEVARRFPRALSQGQRQRVNLARALALEPELLLLDEPVSALDVSVQAQMVILLERLAAARGFAMLFVSHDEEVVARLCQRVLTMSEGRVHVLAEPPPTR